MYPCCLYIMYSTRGYVSKRLINNVLSLSLFLSYPSNLRFSSTKFYHWEIEFAILRFWASFSLALSLDRWIAASGPNDVSQDRWEDRLHSILVKAKGKDTISFFSPAMLSLSRTMQGETRRGEARRGKTRCVKCTITADTIVCGFRQQYLTTAISFSVYCVDLYENVVRILQE